MKISRIFYHQEEAVGILDRERIAEADQTTAVIAIVRKSTTERETATMTPVAAAEAQEAIIEAGAKASEVEEILIVKAVEENLVSTEITGHLRVLVEAEDVAAITRGSRATITLVVEILQVAIQTGFDIR
tara:strand:+ start:73 stop:462 length:390 start_codon:yes stop_codon:yes gene_type:complete